MQEGQGQALGKEYEVEGTGWAVGPEEGTSKL